MDTLRRQMGKQGRGGCAGARTDLEDTQRPVGGPALDDVADPADERMGVRGEEGAVPVEPLDQIVGLGEEEFQRVGVTGEDIGEAVPAHTVGEEGDGLAGKVLEQSAEEFPDAARPGWPRCRARWCRGRHG